MPGEPHPNGAESPHGGDPSNLIRVAPAEGGTTVDLLLVLVTLAVFAWIGFRAREAGDDLDDYVTARGSQGAGPLGLSFFASGMGAWILFAPPEVGAFVGAVAVVGYAVGAAGPFVVFASLGRRVRAIVPSGHGLTEFVRLRFGRVFHGYVVAISILYMGVFVTAELTAVGAVAAITSDVAPSVAIVATALVTLAYTAYGGLRASLRTDRWQGWLILALLGVAAVAVVGEVADPGEAVRSSGLVDVDRVGVEAAITLVIAVVAANLFHNGYWQRLWAARDQAALTRGAAIGAATSAPVVAAVGLLGLVAAGAGATLGDPPAPFFALTGAVAWAAPLVLVLGVALVASSVDTLENGLGALVVAERPTLTLRDARLVTAVLLLPALVVALQGYSVLRLFLVADLLCAATVVPVLLGLWPRTTPAAALAGAVAGLVATVVPGAMTTGSVAEGVLAATFPDGVPTLPPFLAALVASTIVSVVWSLVANRTTDLHALAAEVPALR